MGRVTDEAGKARLSDAFAHLCLAADTHRVLTADESGYRFIGNDMFSPFESHLTGESQEMFRALVDEGNEAWKTAYLLRGEARSPVLLRVQRREREGSLLVTLADPEELAEQASLVMQQEGFTEAIRTLYGDTWWTWNPQTRKVMVYASSASLISSGSYSEEEIHEALGRRVDREDLQKAMALLEGIRTSPAAFHADLALPDPNDPGHCRLFGLPTVGEDGSEYLVGTMHRFQVRANELPGAALDPLTGLLNKTEIRRCALRHIREGRRIALVMVDLDFFKNVNDRFGHAQGDEVLRRTAEAMRSAVRGACCAGRYGGDEFLLILDAFRDEDDIRHILRNLRNTVRSLYPDTGTCAAPVVTLSMGCALYPDHASKYHDLFSLADACLYLAKEKGRNRYIIFTPEKHGAPEAFLRTMLAKQQGVNDRPGTNPDEVLVSLAYDIRYGTRPRLSAAVSRYARVMELPGAAVLAGDPLQVAVEAGEGSSLPAGSLEKAAALLADIEDLWRGAPLAVDNMDQLPGKTGEALARMGFGSLLLFGFWDARGEKALLLFYRAGGSLQWNRQHFSSHRLFADVLGQYDLSAGLPGQNG